MFFLYHGEDNYLSLLSAKEKLEQLKEQSKLTTVISIDADTADSTTIVSKISSTDMFSARNIIFLKRVFKNKDKDRLIENLTAIIQDNNAVDIIFWEDHKVNGVTRYYKFFKKNNALEEFAPMKPQAFIKWANQQIGQKEIKADRESLYELSSRTNFQTERFINELEKISLAGITELTLQKVQQNTSDTLEFTIWKLMDAINASDKKQSLSILESLFDRNEDPHYIIAMISRNTRLLVGTKDLVDKGLRAAEIASKLKVPPFTVFPLLNSVKNSSMEKLKSIYEKIASLDTEIKSGNIDPQLGLTLLVSTL